MPLQNRVTPLGEVIADPARGLVYGNRGGLHDQAGRVHRKVQREAVDRVPDAVPWLASSPARAAGSFHRVVLPGRGDGVRRRTSPRARSAAVRTTRASSRSGVSSIRAAIGADAIDAQLHAERVDPATRGQLRNQTRLDELPDGAFVLRDGTPWLVLGDAAPPMDAGRVRRAPSPAGRHENGDDHAAVARARPSRPMGPDRPDVASIGAAWAARLNVTWRYTGRDVDQEFDSERSSGVRNSGRIRMSPSQSQRRSRSASIIARVGASTVSSNSTTTAPSPSCAQPPTTRPFAHTVGPAFPLRSKSSTRGHPDTNRGPSIP